jgi:hypothetical protein
MKQEPNDVETKAPGKRNDIDFLYSRAQITQQQASQLPMLSKVAIFVQGEFFQRVQRWEI